MSVYAPMLGTLWRILESYDIDPREAIPEKFYRPGARFVFAERVSFKDYDAIQAHAAALIKDPAMGVRTGFFAHPSHLGALGYAWLASSSLRTALKRARRFSRMFHEHVELCLEESPDRVLIFHRMSKVPTRPNLVGDGQVAGLLALCRASFGESLLPLEVTFRREEPSNPAPWVELFGGNLKFGQARNSLAISAADADRELTTSNPAMVSLHEQIIQRHLMKMDRENLVNRARLHIMEQLPSGRVMEDKAARDLNVSKRSLQRKLREEGETFRSLLTQVRMSLADRYLQNEDYSVTEIAFLLGYTDTSAFSRAFKTWFGHSPTRARELKRAA